MCKVYPSRRQELDAYKHDIIETALTTRRSAFKEYQKAFSAQASTILLQQNINWFIRDTKLFTIIFSGQTVVRCELCCSVTHASHFCLKFKMGSTPYVGNANGKTKLTPSNLNFIQRGRNPFRHL